MSTQQFPRWLVVWVVVCWRIAYEKSVLWRSEWLIKFACWPQFGAWSHVIFRLLLNFFVSKDARYVGIIALCFMMRPTTAIFWLPMVTYDILARSKLSTFFGKMLPQALIIPSVVILIDSFFYGKLTIVPWNFLCYNPSHSFQQPILPPYNFPIYSLQIP